MSEYYKILNSWGRKRRLPYWIWERWKRLQRAIRWFWFMYKLSRWNEYDNFQQVTSQYLLEMAHEFETDHLTASSKYDARKMRLAAELLKRGCQGHYSEKYYESSQDPDKVAYAKTLEFDDMMAYETAYPGREDWFEVGERKDKKAIHLAFEIMKRHLREWWQ